MSNTDLQAFINTIPRSDRKNFIELQSTYLAISMGLWQYAVTNNLIDDTTAETVQREFLDPINSNQNLSLSLAYAARQLNATVNPEVTMPQGPLDTMLSTVPEEIIQEDKENAERARAGAGAASGKEANLSGDNGGSSENGNGNRAVEGEGGGDEQDGDPDGGESSTNGSTPNDGEEGFTERKGTNKDPRDSQRTEDGTEEKENPPMGSK